MSGIALGVQDDRARPNLPTQRLRDVLESGALQYMLRGTLP